MRNTGTLVVISLVIVLIVLLVATALNITESADPLWALVTLPFIINELK